MMKVGSHVLSSILSVIALLTPICSSASYSLQGFGPSQYLGGSPSALATMQSNLGISGFEIEDFATLALPTGRLTFSGGGVQNVVAENGNSWGATGTGFLRVITSVGNPATIQIAGGTSALGIGFSAFESGSGGALTSLSINGGTPVPLNASTLPTFGFAFGVRNGYLLVSAGLSDAPIARIDLIQTGSLDGYQIDYIATSPVPEPSGREMLALGAIFLLAFARKGTK